ncbi:MAG: 5'/3'-nucleotidase SurE [Paraprevotella sp.]|nr:5'/3'-nucleotidase SurE [Paraprevotella sp.]
MNDKRPLILLSNDDGVQAKGLNELIDMLSPMGDLLVMAPDGARSGAACGITSHNPLRYKVLSVRPGVKICACSGTPVDCVKLAIEKETDRRPDIVVSGINHGDNSSVRVHYSGTMGVALEGCMKGIPSVGFSLCDFDEDADFAPAAPYVHRITERILHTGLPSGVCLNVNFPKPSAEPYAGMKICRMARGTWSNEWYEADHPKGTKYFWLTGEYTNLEPEATDTDEWALAHGWVAVVPVTVDMTAYAALNSLKDLETL